MARPIAMMVATMPSIRSVLLSCGRLLLRRRYRAAAGGGDHRDPARASVEGIQRGGAADGIIGRNPIAAIARFRSDHRLPAGQIDDELKTALGSANEEIAGLLLP